MEIIERIISALPNVPDEIWTNGMEILTKSERVADIIADIIDSFYGETISHTGYYDPEEDERNGEADKYTGYYYIDFD